MVDYLDADHQEPAIMQSSEQWEQFFKLYKFRDIT